MTLSFLDGWDSDSWHTFQAGDVDAAAPLSAGTHRWRDPLGAFFR